jgi:hypothetical protein
MKTIKLNKSQLRKLINESFGGHPEDFLERITVRDIDTGDQHRTFVGVQHDMLVISFGNSFTLHLDERGANELAQLILEGSQALSELMVGDETDEYYDQFVGHWKE